jgi:nitrite reductase/ring-hydroxylating ferredoxin subunit
MTGFSNKMELKIKKNKISENKIIEISKNPKIILYNSKGKYFVSNGICPHAKWPLELGSVKEDILTCGGHGWEFNIKNGKCKSNPGRDLKKYNVTEINDTIIISD